MKFPEEYRDRSDAFRVPHKMGDPFGLFIIPASAAARRLIALRCVASNGSDQVRWEHVSVSTAVRCPTWEEMCVVKALFWDPHECVVQFHPPEEDYVNMHPYCLHLWKPLDGVVLPRPPSIAVGIR